MKVAPKQGNSNWPMIKIQFFDADLIRSYQILSAFKEPFFDADGISPPVSFHDICAIIL